MSLMCTPFGVCSYAEEWGVFTLMSLTCARFGACSYVAEVRVKNVAGQAGQLDAPSLTTEADVGRRCPPNPMS